MSDCATHTSYADSGDQWLGKVPANWTVKPIKYLAVHIGSGKTPSGGAQVYQDFGVKFLRSQNVHDSGLRLDDVAYISEEIDKEMSASRVRRMDVLLNITGASIGRTCMVSEDIGPANVNQHVCIVRAADVNHAAWISKCLASQPVKAQIDFWQNGAGREGLNFEQIGNMRIPMPLPHEIDAITSRLNRETTRIDALVDRKTRFIELLHEKRRALVTHAVTKGLDPSVNLKNSGVAWLGQVPEHWGVVPLKYVVSFRSGGTPSKDNLAYWDGDVPWASAKDLKQERLRDTQDHLTALAIESGMTSLVPAGSVLIVVRGMILARIFPVVEAMVPMAINQDLKALLPSKRLEGRFLAHLLRGLEAESLNRLEEAGHGTKALRMDNWASMEVAVPPVDEQRFIVSCLEVQTTRLDRLIEKTANSIQLLKERRAVLTTAAVTGQIDLRGAA